MKAFPGPPPPQHAQPWGQIVTFNYQWHGEIRTIRLVYLCAEGVQAYHSLFYKQRVFPRLICLIFQTGFTNNWTDFANWKQPLGRLVGIRIRSFWPVGGDGYHAGLSIQRPRVRFPHRPLRSMVDVAQSGERRSVAPEAPGSIPAIHPRFGDAIPQRSGWRCLASASPGWPEAGIRERSSRMSTLRQGEERGFKSRRLRQKWIGNSGGQSTCLLSRESWVRIPPDPLLLPL